jgi:hypothetical protein
MILPARQTSGNLSSVSLKPARISAALVLTGTLQQGMDLCQVCVSLQVIACEQVPVRSVGVYAHALKNFCKGIISEATRGLSVNKKSCGFF